MSSASLDREDPELRRQLHNLWIAELYHSLKPQVAGRLTLAIDQEVTLVEVGGTPSRLRPDLHLSERKGQEGSAAKAAVRSRATAYAEGVEEVSSDTRHFLVLRDLADRRVVGILEVLSPTNQGVCSQVDLDAFSSRRRRILSTDASYLEVDALRAGTRWLPQCLSSLAP